MLYDCLIDFKQCIHKISFLWPAPFFSILFIWLIPFGWKMSMEFHKNIERIADSRERSRNCVECGRSIPWDANLCPYCGHKYS